MLAKKVANVGFEALRVVERRPVGLDELARYPVFPEEFVAFLRRAIPEDRHAALVWAVTVTARNPGGVDGA